jgi:hypothetical protein
MLALLGCVGLGLGSSKRQCCEFPALAPFQGLVSFDLDFPALIALGVMGRGQHRKLSSPSAKKALIEAGAVRSSTVPAHLAFKQHGSAYLPEFDNAAAGRKKRSPSSPSATRITWARISGKICLLS